MQRADEGVPLVEPQQHVHAPLQLRVPHVKGRHALKKKKHFILLFRAWWQLLMCCEIQHDGILRDNIQHDSIPRNGTQRDHQHQATQNYVTHLTIKYILL